ncbi:hypothetical protein HWV62_32005 [Athelia sp. TMB]|nr:hypothetical protein HWV62_32005 [Athelia sp. TMB]
MTLSRQSSYETFVFSQPPSPKAELSVVDLLPLVYSDPSKLRKDLDINGLSEAARKSWATLKPFQSPTSCFFNTITPEIINKIADRVDETSTAIKTTLGAAQMGRAFANNIADLYTLEYVEGKTEALIAKTIAIADRAYGRTIQAHGQLICARTGLSEVASKIPAQVAKTERELKKEMPYTFFNGINHTVVSVPQTSNNPTSDEDRDTWTSDDMGGMLYPAPAPGFGTNQPDYLTFQQLINRLDVIVGELGPFINRINSAAMWWAEMKRSLEAFASSPAARPALRQDAAEQWRSVADQYTVYTYKGGEFYSDDEAKAEPTPEKPKKAPLWKRIVCLGMA